MRAAPASPAGARGSRRLVGLVLDWWEGARAARDALPWRATREPWAVLVAEVMLAQTQAARVGARYPAFLDRFPTPRSCADAPAGEVLRAWSGLGYNRRALALHRAARVVVERHGGSVPSDLGALVALPGVGPYTARAVLSFAFGAEIAVVDTNVGRLLARAVAGRRLRASEALALAERLLPVRAAREWNLAAMDFGSLVCRARPSCATCPLAAGACAWRAGGASEDPARGSAAVSAPQRAFEGSDRQGRGRLLRAACAGPIHRRELARLAGWPGDARRAAAVARRLVAEGLLVEDAAGLLRLPGAEEQRRRHPL